MPSHPPQGVDEAGHGGALPVPRLPQVEDGLGGAGLGAEEGAVPVDPQPVGQHPPVVVGVARLVQELGQALLDCQGDPEGRSPVCRGGQGGTAGGGGGLARPGETAQLGHVGDQGEGCESLRDELTHAGVHVEGGGGGGVLLAGHGHTPPLAGRVQAVALLDSHSLQTGPADVRDRDDHGLLQVGRQVEGADYDDGSDENLVAVQAWSELMSGHHTHPDVLRPAGLQRSRRHRQADGGAGDGDLGPGLPHPGPGHSLLVSTPGQAQAGRGSSGPGQLLTAGVADSAQRDCGGGVGGVGGVRLENSHGLLVEMLGERPQLGELGGHGERLEEAGLG